MVRPVDTSAMEKVKSYRDYDREAEEFQLKKQLAQAEVKKAGMLDVDKLGETAFMKAAMGEQLTPQEEAAARYVDAKSGGMVFNPATGEVMQKPRISEKIGLPGMKPAQAAAPAMSGAPVDKSVLQAEEMLANQKLPEIGAVQMPSIGGGANPPTLALPPEVEALVANNPKARQAALEEQIKLQTQVQQNQLNKKLAKPAVTRAYTQVKADYKNMENAIDRAIGLTSGWTAGAGSTLAGIPGTPARNLQAALTTIAADSAFSTLQTMRDNSKTGGALGAISDRELQLLRDAKTALDQAQSPQALRDSLARYKEIRNQALRNVAEAYKDDYGFYPDEVGTDETSAPAAPSGVVKPRNIPMSAAKELRANPQTAAQFDAIFGAGAAKTVLGK